MSIVKVNKNSGGEVTGYSPGHGDITVQDKDHENVNEWDVGVYKNRVGHYRLWKERDGELAFHHFWKSSTATRSNTNDEAETYYLGYDSDSLEPTYFGISRRVVIVSLWIWFTTKFTYVHYYIEQIYGNVPLKLQQFVTRGYEFKIRRR